MSVFTVEDLGPYKPPGGSENGAGPAPRRILSDTHRQQLVTAEAFVLDAPSHVPAVWGEDGHEVLWSEGEALLIGGPQGVGKSTLLQQILGRRAGILDGELIGYPVAADTDRLTLLLALDRPKQIARSFKRMVTDAHEHRLGRLVVWTGPLPFNVVKEPEMLAVFTQEVGEIIGTPIGTVGADSLKDMASPLSSDEVGAALNRAIGGVIAQGIEWASNHHQRKATSENKKPTTLADVYGSVWITAGAGSVVLLWGEPGDPLVELSHLKQPAEEIGPLELSHDHENGTISRCDRLDAWTILQGATGGGVTAANVAETIYGKTSKAQVEKARRKLEKLVKDGHAAKINGRQTSHPTVYRPIASVRVREGSREGVTGASRLSRNPVNTGHAPLTDHERSGLHPTGVVDRDRGRDSEAMLT